jgi:predicted transcriptional regulator
MSTSELKYNLFKAIDSINDSKALKDIYSFITKKTDVDFWDELSDEQKAEIEESIAEHDRGEGISHEEVMKEIKAKYKI